MEDNILLKPICFVGEESRYAKRDPYCWNNCFARIKKDERYCSKRIESPIIKKQGLKENDVLLL